MTTKHFSLVSSILAALELAVGMGLHSVVLAFLGALGLLCSGFLFHRSTDR